MTAMVASTACISVSTLKIGVMLKKKVLGEETTAVVSMTLVIVAVEVVVSRAVLVSEEPVAPNLLTVKVEEKTPELSAVTVTVAVLEKIVSEEE